MKETKYQDLCDYILWKCKTNFYIRVALSAVYDLLLCDRPRALFIDVIYVGEDEPTATQRAKAKELQLPPHFYKYEEKPDCSGCRGCEKGPL